MTDKIMYMGNHAKTAVILDPVEAAASGKCYAVKKAAGEGTPAGGV